MAKDVDLSSQGWTDLIFEGKNKEFGAYQLRKGSASRHNKSVIIVMIILIIVLTVVILQAMDIFPKDTEEDAAIGVEQEQVMAELPEEIEEDIEVFDMPPPPPPEEVIPIEEVAAEQLVTELKLVDEVDETKEIKDVSEVMENEAQFGNKDVEGTADLNKTEVEDKVIVEEKPVEAPKVEQVFTVVEQPASYPGGEAELLKWIANNLQYPPMAIEDNAQGRVVVRFVVEKDGRIGHVEVARGRHPELDKEAVRVVKSIKTRFIPGKNNGQPVRQWFTLPIVFKLGQ